MNFKLEKYISLLPFAAVFLLSGCIIDDSNNAKYSSAKAPYTYYRSGSAEQAKAKNANGSDAQILPKPANKGKAGSRYYSNPYDISPYYDYDQYYVAPSYYGSNANNPDGGFEKF